MDTVYNSLNILKTKIPNYWGSTSETDIKKNITHIATPQILEISNILNAISENVGDDIENVNIIKLDIPRIVTVGTQSSGKSSVVNGIMGFDMLPTGKNMVTRTPLHLQLVQTDADMWVEFGNYSGSNWKCDKKIVLSCPEPTVPEITQIRNEIEELTIQKAGTGLGVSSEEIIIKFYSPYVPSLSLIDLPGLTNIACTDKGQPKDIKDQIKKLLIKYIQPEKSLILAVMAARTDLETDMGLDLIKEFDKNGQRTIGILTKIDLMNNETDICDYLYNNVSIDLQLKYGYYAVKNRNSSEMMTMSHKEGLKKETEYFHSHHAYSKLDETTKKRLGIINVGESLSNILVQHIRKSLPELLSNLKILQMQTEDVVKDLGVSIPEDEADKMNFMQTILNKFASQYVASLEDRGASINVGRKIRDKFDNFRTGMQNINPFSKQNDEYFANVIRNCEGNHMSLFALPIEVLEYCLRDKDMKPFMALYHPAVKCVDDITNEMTQLINEVITVQHLDNYPPFISHIRDLINHEILNIFSDKTKREIKNLIDAEETYIWTNSKKFDEEVKKIMSDKHSNPQMLRLVVEKYYLEIKTILEHNIPKYIMLFLVRSAENKIYSTLYEHSSELMMLLQEKPEEEAKRDKYRKCLKALHLANEIFEKI